MNGNNMNWIYNGIAQQLKIRPDDIAIRSAQRSFFKEEIAELIKANVNLFKSVGLVPGARVGVCLPMSADFIISALSIWAHGCSFVPIAEEDPLSRQRNICDRAKLSAIIVAADNEAFKSIAKLRISDGVLVSTGELCEEPPQRHDDESYVIFTSGSTGVPKGVSISHDSLEYYIRSSIKEYGPFTEDTLAFSQLPPTFDASITCYLVPLLLGNEVSVLPPNVDATEFLRISLINAQSPIFFKLTPSQLRLLASRLSAEEIKKLIGTVIVGGEALYFTDLTPFADALNLRFFNEYGPTEATVGCIIQHVSRPFRVSGNVPVGKPFAGTSTEFLAHDEGDGLIELVLKGPGVASNYVGATAEETSRFGVAPDGLRTYRTGDLFSIDHDGVLTYRRRIDHQIKINGYRIELDEVELAASSVLHGRRCVALEINGEIALVVESPVPLNVDWAHHFNGILPAYMHPDRVKIIQTLPLTRHGKVDVSTLRSMLDTRGNAATAQDPSNSADSLRSELHARWGELLKIKKIEGDVNFFQAGGDSLSALKLTAWISNLLGRRIPLSLIFEYPSLDQYESKLRSLMAEIGVAQPTTL